MDRHGSRAGALTPAEHGDTLTAKPPGLGLGLSFATTIAAAHSGSVTCEGAPGGGAVFVVRMPLAPAHASPPGNVVAAGT
jgi:signal transduction histidine kinase